MILGGTPYSVLPLSSLYDSNTTDNGLDFDFFVVRDVAFQIKTEKRITLQLVEFEPNESTMTFTLKLERNPEVQLDL